MTPFYANYGFEPDITREPLKGELSPAAFERVEKLKTLQKDLQEDLIFLQERMKKYYDKKRVEGPTLQKGDKVYLLRKNLKTKRPSNKLDFKKLGPFKVEKVILKVNY